MFGKRYSAANQMKRVQRGRSAASTPLRARNPTLRRLGAARVWTIERVGNISIQPDPPSHKSEPGGSFFIPGFCEAFVLPLQRYRFLKPCRQCRRPLRSAHGGQCPHPHRFAHGRQCPHPHRSAHGRQCPHPHRSAHGRQCRLPHRFAHATRLFSAWGRFESGRWRELRSSLYSPTRPASRSAVSTHQSRSGLSVCLGDGGARER